MKTSTTYLNLAVPEAEAPQVVLSEVTILALSATHFVTSMPIDRHPALSIHRSLVRLLFAVKCLEEVQSALCTRSRRDDDTFDRHLQQVRSGRFGSTSRGGGGAGSEIGRALRGGEYAV